MINIRAALLGGKWLSIFTVSTFIIFAAYSIIRRGTSNIIEISSEKDSSSSAHVINTKVDSPQRPPPATSSQRQNIVLVIIGKLGIGDLKCYDSTFHETPNIDALAAEGIGIHFRLHRPSLMWSGEAGLV